MKLMYKSGFVFMSCFLFVFFELQAQVGYNNPNPHPSALVDMSANNKGLLIPRMTSAERSAMAIASTPPAEGLLVFDTDVNRFFYWDDNVGAWRPVNFADVEEIGGEETVRIYSGVNISDNYNGVQPPANGLIVEGNVGIGTDNPTVKLEVHGDVGFVGKTYVSEVEYVDPAMSYLVPAEAIIMWSGSSLPPGWSLCDGYNGTPDLRDRFIVGSGMSYTVGNTGGQNQVTLNQAQTPLKNHRHYLSLSTNTNGSHSHWTEGSSANNLAHRHRYYSGNTTVDIHKSPDNDDKDWRGTFHTNNTGNHSHSVSGNTNYTNDSGASPHENRPPFYALAFIMKL